MTSPHDELAAARERTDVALTKLKQYESNYTYPKWGQMKDRAKKAIARYQEAIGHCESLLTFAENEGGTAPGPDPKVFEYSVPGLPWGPQDRKDRMIVEIPEAPSGQIAGVEMRVHTEGTPDDPSIINRFCSLGQSKQNGDYEHPFNFIYAFWKGGKLTWRQGWNVKHGDKTKDTVNMSLGVLDSDLAVFDQGYEEGDGSFNICTANGLNGIGELKGDLPPVLGPHGVTLVLTGHGDEPPPAEPNWNETAIIGVTYTQVDLKITYA